jgi:DNA-binding PadR family transcriptional regulator
MSTTDVAQPRRSFPASYPGPVARSTIKTLDVVLLGLLDTVDRTGYDVRKWFDRYGPYVGYSAQTSQIYRQLARLVEHGWATTRADNRSGAPDAKVYSLTDAGRAELKRWVDSPYVPSRRPLDPDFQIRLQFAGRTSPQKALELVRTELAFRREQERAGVPVDETAMRPEADEAEVFWTTEFQLLGRERGHYMVRALIAWLEAAEARLEWLCTRV